MNLTDKRRNRIFWILQFSGWGFLNLFSIIFLEKFGPKFTIFSVVAGIFVGVLATTLLRYYLKHNISLDDLRLKEFMKIVGAVLVAALIYGGLSFAFGFSYEALGIELSKEQKNMLKAFDNPWILVFNSIFMMVTWVVCYLVIKLLLRANKNRLERLELNTSLKQAQLNTLKGQINPHFMFNSLNNIRGLMLEDVEKSREMLTKLSEMLRYSLTKNNIDGIALEEELEMVDNYIALSKIQFEDRLKFNKTIAQDTLQLQIPPMIIQLLVENAAKHGISNLKQGGTIDLHVAKNDGMLNIQVKNTGKLQIAKNSTQLGLKNIRQRLKLLYGENAVFSLKEVDDHVVANIEIPLV